MKMDIHKFWHGFRFFFKCFHITFTIIRIQGIISSAFAKYDNFLHPFGSTDGHRGVSWPTLLIFSLHQHVIIIIVLTG